MLWWWLACSTSAPAPEVTVVFGARGQGEIEPCGCPERPVGGLARRNGALAQKRAEGPVVVVEAGLTLAPDQIDERFLEQRQRKAALIAEALAVGGVDGLAFGASDWSLGREFLVDLIKEHHLPVLAANLKCTGDLRLRPGKVVQIHGHRVGLVGLTDGAVPGCEITDPAAAIQDAVDANGPVDATILLAPYPDDRTLAGRLPGAIPVDIVVDARGRATAAGAERRGDTWFVGAGAEMHTLSWMTLSFTPGARTFIEDGYGEKLAAEIASIDERLSALAPKLTGPDGGTYARQADAYRRRQDDLRAQQADLGAARHRFALASLDLDASVPDDVATAASTALAKQQMDRAAGSEGARAFVPRTVADPSSPWLGGEGCVACHKEQHAQWSTTGHVRAWAALKESDRSMDQDCWSCHVTGANTPGGPALPTAAAGFHDVQCEACHGPGRAHASNPTASPLAADPGADVCVTCHDGKRDGGRFDFASYRAKIAHPAAP